MSPDHSSRPAASDPNYTVDCDEPAIRRGTFHSVRDLNAKIRAFVTGWNDRCHPFVWTKTADDILKKANRQTTSNTDH
jgi:hypothetical protein